MNTKVIVGVIFVCVKFAMGADLVKPTTSPSPSPTPSFSPSPSPSSLPSPSPSGTQVSVFEDELLKVRDPFKMFDVTSVKVTPKPPIEEFPVDSFRLIGVLTGPEHFRALVEAPNGKTFFISEKSRIGNRDGFVLKVSPASVWVREKIINVIGQEEILDTEIVLVPQSKLTEGVIIKQNDLKVGGLRGAGTLPGKPTGQLIPQAQKGG